MVQKSLSLSRIVGATSAPPSTGRPPSCPTPPLSFSNSDPAQPGVPGARSVARPDLGTCARDDHSTLTPTHSTALNPAARNLQSDLTLWTLTFLKGVKGDRSRHKNTAKRVMGPPSQDPPHTCNRSRSAEKLRHRAPMAGREDAEQTLSSGAVGQGRVRPGWSRAEVAENSVVRRGSHASEQGRGCGRQVSPQAPPPAPLIGWRCTCRWQPRNHTALNFLHPCL